MKIAFPSPIWLTLAVFLFTLPTGAVDHAVHMTSAYQFVPSYLEIQVGDTVTWYNDGDDSLGARSDTGFVWDTGGVGIDEHSDPVQFNIVGTFPYYDPTYEALGMTGTIVVLSSTPSPTPALIVEPSYLAGGEFRFTVINLTVGKTTVIESSTNLLNWIPVVTNLPTANSLNFTNSATDANQLFRSFQIP